MKNIVVVYLFAFASCIGEHEIDLPSEPPRIVIDGLISDRVGESYVNIGWSTTVNSSCTDVFGHSVRCDPGTFNGPYKVNGLVRVIEDNGARTVEVSFRMNDKEGMILVKPEITGSPGHQYKLEVEIDYGGIQEHYSAVSKMLQTPEITDINYEVREGDVGKSDHLVPLISFTEPEGDNYYLFQICSADRIRAYCENSRAWNYSIIADTFLPPAVHGLSIDDGASIAKYAEFYPNPEMDAGVQVRMYSVDRLTYNFYKSLIDQFNNDGGAYSPTPAMPRGNISEDGIGLFRALKESSATVFYR